MKSYFLNIFVLNFLIFINFTGFLFANPIQPGPLSYEEIQKAMILSKPGDVIELGEGIFEFEDGLSLDIDNVTISGEGINKTILSFKNQKSGAEGLMITSNGVILKDFAVEDTIGDAIVVKGANGISFIRVRTEWTGGPKESNGAYGFYPVQSTDVLIDGCVAIGASDAGIYVGQSERIKVLNSIARYNVAGIEIENSFYAEVIGNISEHNTGGILVFDLPDLPQQGGHHILVENNIVRNNDTENFAPEGNIVGNTPNGTGIMVMANQFVEIKNNEIKDNATAGILIASYQDEAEDKNYNPIASNIFIHGNSLNNNGFNVDKVRASPISEVINGKVPDIIWDGVVPLTEWIGIRSSKRIILGNNYSNSDTPVFANLKLMTKFLISYLHKVDTNYENYRGELKSIQPVVFKKD